MRAKPVIAMNPYRFGGPWRVVVIFVVIPMLAFVLYRSHHSANQSNVDPHAAREIEEAKRH